MEKQTQIKEIVTNTNRSVTYMPQPNDGAPRVVTLIPGDGIGPLVTEAVEQRRMMRESRRNRFGTMRLRLSWRSSTFSEKLTRSLIYKPISSLLPPSNPPTDLTAIRPTRQSHRCQTHLPISPPSNPPTKLWSFTSLFLSIYLSLSLSHNQCLFLRKTEFFLLCFFVDLVYIFRFPILIFKPTHLKSFSFFENILHFEIILHWAKYGFLFLFLCSSVFLF